MSAQFPHLRPRDHLTGHVIFDQHGEAWNCTRPGCRQVCTNGDIATDCHGVGSGWPNHPLGRDEAPR